MESESNVYKIWNTLREKYEVSAERRESLIELTEAWNACKLNITKVDLDN